VSALDRPTLASTTSNGELFGRNAELEVVERFLNPDSWPAVLIVEGEAGMGKTVLWRAALETATARGYRILSCRGSRGEGRLSYSNLGDLLRPALEQSPSKLQPSDESVLRAALLRMGARAKPDALRVFLATLDALQELAARQPILLAIDDVQWLDSASMRGLRFVAHRLGSQPIGILATLRLSHSRPLLLDFMDASRVHRMVLGPLSAEALGEAVAHRYGFWLPGLTLMRLHQATGGNPLFTLEIAGELAGRHFLLAAHEPIPLPRRLVALAKAVMPPLEVTVQEAVMVVASLANPTVPVVELVLAGGRFGSVALNTALAAGQLDLAADEIRLVHPLVATTLYSEATPQRRREVHQLIAQSVPDPSERIWHRAVASTGPDARLAAELDSASALVSESGRVSFAADLADQALRLTPPGEVSAIRVRTLAAADRRQELGHTGRARQLLDGVLPTVSDGAERAEVLWRLGILSGWQSSWHEAVSLLERASTEADEGDRRARARVELAMGWSRLRLGEAEDGLRRSRIALALAEGLPDESLIGEALGLMGACELLLGRPGARRTLKRVLKLHQRVGNRCAFCHLGRLWGHSLTGYNDHEPARTELLARRRQYVDRGEASFVPGLLLSLSQLECWAGEWDQAVTRVDEGLREAGETGQHTYRGALLASAALAIAHLGDGDRTRALAAAGLKSAKESGDLLAEVANGFALGFLELSSRNPGAADAWLRPGLERLYSLGIREPAILRFLPDEVETLVMLGNLKDASTQLGRWLDLPRRPWVDALARRCRGLLLTAAGKRSAGLVELHRAAEESFALPPFERARTLLMLGVALRRSKQKASAVHLLDQAIAIFDQLRAAIWAKRARVERSRLGLEARPGELTVTEERVAELAAQGLSNRQIGGSLFISSRTVEVNLTRIFHKLDVKGAPGRRRRQLRSRLPRLAQHIG